MKPAMKGCDVAILKETAAEHRQVTESFIKVSLTQMNLQRLL